MMFFHMQNLHATLRRISKYYSQSRQAKARQYEARCIQIKRTPARIHRYKSLQMLEKSCSSCSLAIQQNMTEVHKAHVPQCHHQAFHS